MADGASQFAVNILHRVKADDLKQGRVDIAVQKLLYISRPGS